MNSAPPIANQSPVVASPIRYIFGETIFGKTGIAQMIFDGQNITIQNQSGELVASWALQQTAGYSSNWLIGSAIKYGDQKIILNAITWKPLVFAMPNLIAGMGMILSFNNVAGNSLISLSIFLLVLGHSLAIYLYGKERNKTSGLSSLLTSLSAYGVKKKFFV